MVRWREMHPYNAVHVVTLPQPLDVPRLEACIRRQLEGLGLTGLMLDRRRLRYEWTGGAAQAPLAVLAGGADPRACVQAEMERQLNLGFPAGGGIEPFRFFAVADAPAFHLGLAYDHFVAGGDSIVRLLQRLVEDYYRMVPTDAEQPRPDLYPPGYRRLFARRFFALARGLSSWRYLIASCRRSVRPPYPKDGDGYNGVVFARLDAAESARLAAHGAIVGNDAERYFSRDHAQDLVASGGGAPPGQAAPRPGRRIDRQRAARFRRPGRRRLRAAARIVSRRTPGARRHAAVASSPGSCAAKPAASSGASSTCRPCWRSACPACNGAFFRTRSGRPSTPKTTRYGRGSPRCSSTPCGRRRNPIRFGVGYVRAVSTGPLSPLVLALTTLGDVVEVALSFRRAAIDRRRAEGLLSDILQHIRSIAP